MRIEGVRELLPIRKLSEDVSIYTADLDACYETQSSVFPQYISESEFAESRRFKTPLLQQRFLTSRYLLNRILAKLLDQPAGSLQIARPDGGKPFMPNIGFTFNLSHSRNRFALATSAHGEIGVDIETGISLETAREVAGRVLGPRELASWSSLPEDARVDTFARYWTLKESILKAVGEGLGRDPREIEVTIDEEDPRFLTLPLSYAPATDWRMGFVDTGWPRTRLAYALRLEKS